MYTDLLFALILYPLFFIFPAYCANGAPVLFGGGMPIDRGRKFRGKRIFGDHKTVKGLVAGISAGIIIGFAESLVPGYSFMLIVGAVQGVGAMSGDILGSFIKRQRGLKEGSKGGLMDQYLFLIFALAVSLPLGNFPEVLGILFIAVLTGLLHKFTNIVAHRWKIKEVPW